MRFPYRIAAVIMTHACISPEPAAAQSLSSCNDLRSHVLAIAEPREANTRTYAGGTVRMVIMDVGEPVVGSFRLMILTPPTDANPDGRQCQVLSLDESLGFAGLWFDGATDSTDPTGLTVRIPARRWLATTDSYTDATLSVTVVSTDGPSPHRWSRDDPRHRHRPLQH